MTIDEGNTVKVRINGWLLYLLIYLPLCLLPAVKYSVPYVVAGLFSMLPLFLVALGSVRYRTVLFLLVILGVLQGVVVVLLGNAPVTEIVNEPIRSIRYFVPCVLLEKVLGFGKKGQKFIWLFATALIVLVIFQTLSALETDPMAARLLAQGTIEDTELMNYRFQNVGGFGNCYALCLTFAMWVYFVFNSTKGTRLVSAIVAVFILYFALQVQYMTMLLLCFAAFLLVMMYSSKSVYTKLFGFLFVIFILFFLSSILRWLATLGVERTIYIKLTEFADTLDGVNRLSDTTSRTDLYKNSLLAFLSNPLFGVKNTISSHSTILATAASSGMVGLFAYGYSIKQMYKACTDNMKQRNIDVRIFNIIFVLFIVLSIVNPTHYVYEISVVLLFYIPLTMNLFLEK